MYSSKRRRHWPALAVMVLMVAAALCGDSLSAYGIRDLRAEGAVALKAAVMRSALQCYVVEGVYPPGIAYLEEYYGLRVNREDYYVVYEIFASNVPPEVQVLDRK